jgi:integrase
MDGAANSFEVVTREWIDQQMKTWVKGHGERILTRFEGDIFPWIGARPIADLTAPELLRVGALMRAIDGYEGSLTVRRALRLAPSGATRSPRPTRRTSCRPPRKRLLPYANCSLSPAAAGMTSPVPAAASARSSQRPMSDNAILAAMRRMGIGKDEMSGHGFRAMARTILDEILSFRPDFIEHQLAHAVRDPNGRAYNRTAHLAERRKMMQAWADYLDKLKNGADVIPILKAG